MLYLQLYLCIGAALGACAIFANIEEFSALANDMGMEPIALALSAIISASLAWPVAIYLALTDRH